MQNYCKHLLFTNIPVSERYHTRDILELITNEQSFKQHTPHISLLFVSPIWP